MTDHAELNRRVAEAQGWEAQTMLESGYDPCNNWQQAMELAIEYGISINFDEVGCWCFYKNSRCAFHAPRRQPGIAIVKAAIALLDNEK